MTQTRDLGKNVGWRTADGRWGFSNDQLTSSAINQFANTIISWQFAVTNERMTNSIAERIKWQ